MKKIIKFKVFKSPKIPINTKEFTLGYECKSQGNVQWNQTEHKLVFRKKVYNQ